ncbi:MAG: hypothetical protein Q9M40_07255 [Sulfurimonas sp.]|nr:hypothetical protein [Sulfurimonas sp.]
MKKTDYTIKKEEKDFSVLKNGLYMTQGFFDKESALHSIWVTEGKDPLEFYVEHDNIVFLTSVKPYDSK